MELTFVNGTQLQQEACRSAAHLLLNLPFDAIPLDLTIEFVPDPSPSEPNEFAVTEATYGSTTATIRIDNVAPQWPRPWTGVRFLQETFIHEVAHAYYASLPKTARVAIAQMFGAASDDPSVISPSGAKWVNRVAEGIAETFKDAFLPARHRLFTNRTNKQLSITRYPEFRSLWRDANAGITGTGVIVPAYDFDNIYRFTHVPPGSPGTVESYFVRVDEDDHIPTPYPFKLESWYDHPNPPNFMLSSIGEGLWSFHLNGWEDDPGWQEYLATSDTGPVDVSEPESNSGLLLPPGTPFKVSFPFPEESFFVASDADQEGAWQDRPYEGQFDEPGLITIDPENGGIHFLVFFMYYDAKGEIVAWKKWKGGYYGHASSTYPESTPSLWAWRVLRLGDAQGHALPHTVEIDTQVPSDVHRVNTCAGEMVRVRVHARVFYHWGRPESVGGTPPSFTLGEIQSQLPSHGVSGLRAECRDGVPIDVPVPQLAPVGYRGGARRSRRKVSGGRA